ncbi:ABC transporter ATP-binding protein [Paracoccus denitrificans]|jgi:ATP-binding cassette subfamily B protein|uniref:ABC transporter related protein n=1 Tax=Paracoccus denitrificans (strain Pd 1222) TaxID=318586 RepID=A1B249_PARDP|nr:ABC transporter ATP-binding protein [Paracoccus denitrificans]ABL69593.1 ABC transporter related protein [Paracoccus denitrificans PD1222]MBB4626841.1 ATP-binding cassette subfamily B protein [Paracoccus denitrificans]MCU7427676.1 ABC transporter ATP-binding protein/permease [Paracoccus denitrificans]QAR24940.1 ABC transporter ATP-binding protein [Paracoccus denitrificans]UPV93885.1 ABC transporter ATP-binding protein/permease [Paracoccus denitrificans]
MAVSENVERSAASEVPERPDFFASLKLLMRYGEGAKPLLVLSALLATGAVVLELVPIWVVWRLVIALIDGTASAGLFASYALIALAAVIAGYLLMGLALGLSHVAAFRLIHALRLAMARHLARLPMGWFAGRRSGGAKKLIVDEPERLEILVAHGLPEGVSAIGTWLAVTIWLFAVDWRMALAAIVLAPVAFGLMLSAMGRTSRMVGQYQAAGERMNGAIVEYLAGMAVIKIFNRSGESLGEAATAVRDYAAIETEMGRQFVPRGALFYTLVVANICVILPVGMLLMRSGTLNLTGLAFFVILGANYSQPLLKLFNLFHNMAHISMASTLIEDVLGTQTQTDTGKRIELPNREVKFENVRFGYDAHEVIHDVSFTAGDGAVTALVGPSGSGKSTLASLIPRLHDVWEGRITLGGTDIRDIGIDQLMEEVAFVFQDTFLFSGTIAENLRLGKAGATEAELHAAARAARAHAFITALPDGYETKLGEGGAALSGGERQRLAIARAILKNAPVIVLDEATAFADPDSEAAIQEALSELARDRTLIVVAHRLHTIMGADRIVVLDQGRLAETGRHGDLVAQGGLYARLWADYTAAQAISLRGNQAAEAAQ